MNNIKTNFVAISLCFLLVILKFCSCSSSSAEYSNDYDDYKSLITALDMLDESMEKRNNVNKFKNMMLNKDVLENYADVFGARGGHAYIPRITPPKRRPDPGAILSWAIPAANRVRVVNPNYRPVGNSRPAAR